MIGTGDIEAIMSNGDFDVSATINGDTVKGWFTEGTQQSSAFTNEIETVNPMFDCPSSVAEDISRGDTITIDSTAYKIERKQVIGIGITTLHLKS